MAESELMTIARPYARAAFAHALGHRQGAADGLAAWSTRLTTLAAVIDTPIVQAALDNPTLTTRQEAALLHQLLGDDLGREGENFLAILAEYGRLTLIPAVAEMFERLKSDYEKTIEVFLTSAFEVTGQEKAALNKALKQKLQREIKLETDVDRALIGGVIIKAEDTVIDDSIRGRLSKLSYALG